MESASEQLQPRCNTLFDLANASFHPFFHRSIMARLLRGVRTDLVYSAYLGLRVSFPTRGPTLLDFVNVIFFDIAGLIIFQPLVGY